MRFIEGYRDLPIFIGSCRGRDAAPIFAVTASDNYPGLRQSCVAKRCVEIVASDKRALKLGDDGVSYSLSSKRQRSDLKNIK